VRDLSGVRALPAGAAPTEAEKGDKPSAFWRAITSRRTAVLLCLLPLAYVDNPIIRLTSVTDDSPFSYGPVAALIGLGFAAGCAGLVSRHIQRPRYALDGAVAALAGIAVLGAVYGLARGNARFYVVDDLFQILEFCIFYFVATTLISRAQDVLFLLKMILALTVACAFTDFITAYLSWNPAVDGFPRISPDGIRALPGLIFPVVVSALVFATRRRVWLGLSFGLLLVWIVASLTRGLWFSNVLALIFLAIASSSKGERLRLARGLGVALVVLAILAIPAVLVAQQWAPHLLDYLEFRITYTPQQLFNPANRIEARRELEVVYVAGDLMRSPLTAVFGEGLGATYLGDTGYSAATLTFGDRHFIHDSYLAYWFRMGIPGLVAYLLLAWRFLSVGLRQGRKGIPRGVLTGLLAAYVAVLVYSITSDSLLRHPTGLFVALAMAAVLVGVPEHRMVAGASVPERGLAAAGQIARETSQESS
jgi:O-antigen ligase